MTKRFTKMLFHRNEKGEVIPEALLVRVTHTKAAADSAERDEFTRTPGDKLQVMIRSFERKGLPVHVGN